jgi:DNA invertase Pin-like site-specific DNA recombinase
MTTSGTIRAATYRRVSTHRQLGGTSPETQLERGIRLIAQQGWEHVGDFYDGAVSGAKASRGDLDRLFETCRAGLVDVVVVGDLFRLSRDLHNSLNFEHELQQLGVQVVDVDNPHAEEHVKQLNYWLGAWQRGYIRKNTHRGILAVAEAGYWPGGPPPFGWRTAPAPDHPKRKVVVLDEAKAATIRKAVELALDDGLTCYQAARRLNALGHFPRKGGRWTNIALRRLLRRGHFAGEWTFHKDGRDFTIRGPEIITAERLLELRKVLDSTATVRPGNRVYPLTGRVTGRCGQPYTGNYRPDRNLRQYECHTNHARFNGTGRRCRCPRVEADWLEETVWAEVAKLLADPDRLLELARQHLGLRRGEVRAEGQQISDLDRKLAEARRKRTNLALAAAATGPEAVADALAEITRDVEALEQMLTQARAWAQANAERSALVRDLWRLAEVAQAKLADPTPKVQREVYAKLDVRVQLAGEGMRHGRNLRPGLRISGVLVGDLAELSGTLGNLADGVANDTASFPRR